MRRRLPRSRTAAYDPGVPSIFTRIIAGEIPARFVWTDDVCVAFLDVRPLAHSHVLVVPRVEAASGPISTPPPLPTS